MKSWKIGVALVGALLCGCTTPVSIGGAKIGDGKVDKTEKRFLNMGRAGLGDQAQSLLGAPADEGPTQEEQLAALGFLLEYDLNLTLNEGVVVKEGQRVISGADISSITTFPRWVPPELKPITMTPKQWVASQVGRPAAQDDAGDPVETPTSPAGKPSIGGLLGDIGESRK